jgi:hypothetical protein
MLGISIMTFVLKVRTILILNFRRFVLPLNKIHICSLEIVVGDCYPANLGR